MNADFDWHTIADQLTDLREYAVKTNSTVLVKSMQEIDVDSKQFNSLDMALSYLKNKVKDSFISMHP